MKPTIHHLRNALFSALFLLLCTVSFANTWQKQTAAQTDQTGLFLKYDVPGDYDVALQFSLLNANAVSARSDQHQNWTATFPGNLHDANTSLNLNGTTTRTDQSNHYGFTALCAKDFWTTDATTGDSPDFYQHVATTDTTGSNTLVNAAQNAKDGQNYNVIAAPDVSRTSLFNLNAADNDDGNKQKNEGDDSSGSKAALFSSSSMQALQSNNSSLPTSVPDHYFFVLAA